MSHEALLVHIGASLGDTADDPILPPRCATMYRILAATALTTHPVAARLAQAGYPNLPRLPPRGRAMARRPPARLVSEHGELVELVSSALRPLGEGSGVSAGAVRAAACRGLIYAAHKFDPKLYAGIPFDCFAWNHVYEFVWTAVSSDTHLPKAHLRAHAKAREAAYDCLVICDPDTRSTGDARSCLQALLDRMVTGMLLVIAVHAERTGFVPT
jgi:hypothetical protein